MQSLRRRACSECTSVPHLARNPLRHLTRIALHAVAHIHMRNGAHSDVQTACPERAMSVAWRAFAGWLAAYRAAPPGHRIPVPSGRGKMQGKIEGCGTTVHAKPVCTWVCGGTRLRAASCREQPQCLAGIGNTVCRIRSGAMGLFGVSP
jgi:hypothetical protein